MNDWRNSVVTEHASIRDAMRIIDASGLRIALVWNESRKLTGVVTDGDIRRGLLTDKNMDDCCKLVMQRNPIVCYRNETKLARRTKMTRIGAFALPIVEEDFTIVGLETLESVVQPELKSNAVFVMAGGFGSRLRPLTETCPKPMLPLDGKPILERIVKSCRNQGFRKFVFSTHYLPEQIHDHFGDGSLYDIELHYLYEEKPLGTAGALQLMPPHLSENPLVLLNGDILSTVKLDELLRIHEEQNNDVTVCVTEKSYQIPYGVVDGESNRLERIREKPNLDFKINTGIYVLGPEFVSAVPKNVETDIPSLIESRLELGKRIGFYVSHDYWLDIGTISDYRKAQQDIVWLDASETMRSTF